MSVSLEVNDVHVLISKVFGDYGYSDPHGTHVAGIAAANTNNDEGIAGIDWYAMINAQDVGNDPGIPEFTQAVIDAVDAGSRVINCSWGYPDFSYTLYYAFIYTYQMGVLPVAALPYPDRNWENPNGFGLWMFTVNASENRDHIAEYTLSKRYTDIAAPGGEYRTTNRQMIISALPEGTYGYGQGTSMAAPHATGVAGLLIAVNPELKNYDLEWIMKKTSDDLYYPPCTQGWDAYSGYGRLNAIEAVKRTLPPYWITRGDASITLFESNKRVLFMNPPRPDVDPYYYWCDLYRIRVTLNFSPEYKEPPWGWFSLTGFSDANPNYAKEWCGVSSTTSSITITTFFYWIKWDIDLGPIYKWAPVDPNILPLKYTVLGPSDMKIVYPNGGECFKNDSDVEITWEISDEHTITSQTVYYSTTSGESWIKIVDLGGTERSYMWHIPRSHTSSSNCRVKVEAEDNQSNTYWDMSDNDFKIWQFEPYLSGMLMANGDVKARLHWSWDPGPYCLDHYELWRNKVVIYSGEGTSYTDPVPFSPGESRSYRVDVFWRRFPGGPLQHEKSSNVVWLTHGGGCPYLFSWTGTEYLEDNNILAGSGEGEDVFDFYKMRQPLEEVDGVYHLDLREFENEYSSIDMVKLIAIDHPEDIDVEILGDDIILPYRDVITPIYCVDQTGEDWTDSVGNPEGGCFEGYEGDTVTMNFGEIESRGYVFLPMAPPKSGFMDVASNESDKGWQTIQTIYPREHSSVSPVIINHTSQDSLKIRLAWHGYHRLEYAAIARIGIFDFRARLCRLLSAVHSNIGSVKLRLLLNDERYVELTPGDTLAFEFAAPVGMQGWVRDFVFVSNGYYITEGEGGPQTSSDNIPLIHSLCIYPNPGRKDMSIRFGLPKEEKISVKIFDVSGREVKTLVDKRLKAGYHIVRLDNMNLPSGIYFARLVTDNYKETKKLVVVR